MKETRCNSCYNCKGYPLCRVYTEINRIINRECIFHTSGTIHEAIAKECTYYKTDKEK